MRTRLEIDLTDMEQRRLGEIVNHDCWNDFVNVLGRVKARLLGMLTTEGISERESDVLRGEIKRVQKLIDFRADMLGLKK